MRKSLFIVIVFILSSCSKHFVANSYSYKQQRITTETPNDSAIITLIKPYKDSLDAEMNIVLAIADTILTKSTPESDLGNLMCDLVLSSSRNYFAEQIDFTFLNNGGIRMPNLPKGEITLGKIIELMPFENRVVLMTLSGHTVDTLFNYMAQKGGWQVSGARYKIQNGKAVEIVIKGQSLNLNSTYNVAVSDYLAQGGDNCNMLKGLPYIDSKRTVRDALIEGLIEMNKRGEHVKSLLDGRVQKIQ